MQSFGRWRQAAPILVALALLAAPLPARAGFVLTLWEGGTFTNGTLQGATLLQTIQDNGAGDSANTLAGVISFSGTVGPFNVSVIGESFPSTSPSSPSALQLLSLTLTNNGGRLTPDTLTIGLSQTDLTLPGGPGSQMTLFSSIGGTLFYSGAASPGQFAYQSFFDNSNATYNPPAGTQVSTSLQTASISPDPSTQQSFDNTTSTVFTRTGAMYSLSSASSFTTEGGGSTLQFNPSVTTSVIAAVPEPASLALGAAGFLLVGLRGWRARKKRS